MFLRCPQLISTPAQSSRHVVITHAHTTYLIPKGCEAAAQQALQQAGITLVGPLQDFSEEETAQQQLQQQQILQLQPLASVTQLQQQQQQQQQHTLASSGSQREAADAEVRAGPTKRQRRRQQRVAAPVVADNIIARMQGAKQSHITPAAPALPPQPDVAATPDPLTASPPAASASASSEVAAAAGGGDPDSLPAAAAAGGSKPAWALAVDRGVAALSGTRTARNSRWSRPAVAPSGGWLQANSPAGQSGSLTNTTSSSSSSRRLQLPQSVMATASIDEFLEGGKLSAEGEQQLCLAYQRYVRSRQLAAQPHDATPAAITDQFSQQQQQQEEGVHASSAATPGDLGTILHDPATVQREGLLAQEVLLQLYEPLVMSRAKRVQAPHADLRDLLVVARQGVLRAAASFDSQRAAKGGDKGRLAALAEMYIRNALRDVLQEYQSAVVHVPSGVRELAARLHRIDKQLCQQQHGRQPSIAEVAAAAGVSVKKAEQALAATGGALQAASLRQVDQDKEDRGKAGSGVDLQQVDVSMEEDQSELSGVVGAGGLAAARSGLREELDAAAERDVVDSLLQGLMSQLPPEDRELLQTKMQGGNISQAARERGKSREWGRLMVDRVVKRLREDVHEHARQNADVAALLSSM